MIRLIVRERLDCRVVVVGLVYKTQRACTDGFVVLLRAAVFRKAIRRLFSKLLFTLVALFACGLYYSYRRAEPRVKASRTRIYRCSVCRHVYVDSRDVPLARCTRCGCLNEAVKR